MVVDFCDVFRDRVGRMKSNAAASPVAGPSKPKAKSVRKECHGVAVRFYRRSPTAAYVMDFEFMKLRVQESTREDVMENALRVALRRVREVKDERLGLTAWELAERTQRGAFATVREVMAALAGGDKVCEDGSLRSYKSGLLRLARVVDAKHPLEVRLDAIFCRGTIERFFQVGQGRSSGVNWVDRLPMNGGLNSSVRNALALLSPRMREMKLAGLRLPDGRAVKAVPKLKELKSEFQPWDEALYAEMEAASQGLRVSDPELWLVNAMLRRLGLRNHELLMARRHWIEVVGERAWLVVKDRPGEFALIKHGLPRKLELDAELQGVLLPRAAGFLIAPDLAGKVEPMLGRPYLTEDARYGLIYRLHSKWMRPWVGEDAAKTNHQLRKYAASKIYKRDGLEAAAYFLGDTVATAAKFYTTWLGGSGKLDGADVAGHG